MYYEYDIANKNKPTITGPPTRSSLSVVLDETQKHLQRLTAPLHKIRLADPHRHGCNDPHGRYADLIRSHIQPQYADQKTPDNRSHVGTGNTRVFALPPDGQADRFAVCSAKRVFTALVQKIRLGRYTPAVYHRDIQLRHRNHYHPTRGFRVADLYPGTGIYGVSAPRTTILRHYRPLLCDGNVVDTPAEECATTVRGVPFRQSEAAVPLYGRKGPSCVVRGPRPRQDRPRQRQAGNRQRGRLR